MIIKEIILFIVAISIGSFVGEILEKTPINIWLARGIGALVSLIVAFLIYSLWIKNTKSTS